MVVFFFLLLQTFTLHNQMGIIKQSTDTVVSYSIAVDAVYFSQT